MMHQALPLRDYQRTTIDRVMADLSTGSSRVAAVLPTGAGKTVVFSHLAMEHLAAADAELSGKGTEITALTAGRILVLAHTDELVTQAYRKVREVAPHLSVGIVKASRNETSQRVIIASVQSLRSPARRAQIRNVGLIIVDECHHAVATTYRAILDHYGAFDGRCKAVGFTATLARGDKQKLGEVWEKVSIKKSIGFMIRRGYLIDVKGKRVRVPDLDLSKVKKSGGDYQDGALASALEASLAPETIADAYVEHASDRQGILFAPTVDSAYAFADAFRAVGITTETVHGALDNTERRAIIARLLSGETQVVTNCMVLTEGFDAPTVSCVVVARPTRSAPLYQQMVGRALRPDPTKPRDGQTALIIDVVGASTVHGLASLVDLSEKEIREDLDDDDDRTLTQIEDDEDEDLDGEGDTIESDPWDGPTEVEEFNPLSSPYVFMKTTGGNYFLSVGIETNQSTGKFQVYVFIMPTVFDDAPVGSYDVAWCTKDNGAWHPSGTPGGITEHRGVSLDAALAWCEDLASEGVALLGGTVTNRKATWRNKPASAPQLTLARRLGIDVPEGAKSGQVSELIDTHKASARIDAIVSALHASITTNATSTTDGKGSEA